MKSAFLFVAQLFFIWAIYAFSKYMVETLDIPIPSSVLGMVILYLLLTCKVIQVKFIEKGAAFLNKHLGFFFVPIAVGLMNYGGLIKAHGLQLLLMIAGSTMIGLAITAGITQYLTRKDKKTAEEDKGYHGQSHSA
ncbi:CidA/LrgA family protein [Neobacillus dielmonensis]|uniref:CidA/LrgA family protein n=1 Tax=Neobacillus dielmonensis TaxID=1347369 RepID=UPI0005A9159F|nr:CidA/LrgA family protein [Neobacillus dielmonensis]